VKYFLYFFRAILKLKQQQFLYKAVETLAVFGCSVVDTYELEYHIVAVL